MTRVNIYDAQLLKMAHKQFVDNLGPINTRTGNYSAKYLFYRYDDVVAMILPVTGFRLECAKINRVESDNYPQ